MIHSDLNLHFLGERPYLQGTTLFDALWPYVPGDCWGSFKITRMIRSDKVRVRDLLAEEPVPAETSALLTWTTQTSAGRLAVRSLPTTPQPVRLPYDETRITGKAVFSGRTAHLRGLDGFSFVSTIVSLNKALLLNLVRHPDPGRWMFVRLDFSGIPATTSELTVTANHILPGGGAAKSVVSLAGKSVGDLYFTWNKGSSAAP